MAGYNSSNSLHHIAATISAATAAAAVAAEVAAAAAATSTSSAINTSTSSVAAASPWLNHLQVPVFRPRQPQLAHTGSTMATSAAAASDRPTAEVRSPTSLQSWPPPPSQRDVANATTALYNYMAATTAAQKSPLDIMSAVRSAPPQMDSHSGSNKNTGSNCTLPTASTSPPFGSMDLTLGSIRNNNIGNENNASRSNSSMPPSNAAPINHNHHHHQYHQQHHQYQPNGSTNMLDVGQQKHALQHQTPTSAYPTIGGGVPSFDHYHNHQHLHQQQHQQQHWQLPPQRSAGSSTNNSSSSNLQHHHPPYQQQHSKHQQHAGFPTIEMDPLQLIKEVLSCTSMNEPPISSQLHMPPNQSQPLSTLAMMMPPTVQSTSTNDKQQLASPTTVAAPTGTTPTSTPTKSLPAAETFDASPKHDISSSSTSSSSSDNTTALLDDNSANRTSTTSPAMSQSLHQQHNQSIANDSLSSSSVSNNSIPNNITMHQQHLQRQQPQNDTPTVSNASLLPPPNPSAHPNHIDNQSSSQHDSNADHSPPNANSSSDGVNSTTTNQKRPNEQPNNHSRTSCQSSPSTLSLSSSSKMASSMHLAALATNKKSANGDSSEQNVSGLPNSNGKTNVRSSRLDRILNRISPAAVVAENQPIIPNDTIANKSTDQPLSTSLPQTMETSRHSDEQKTEGEHKTTTDSSATVESQPKPPFGVDAIVPTNTDVLANNTNVQHISEQPPKPDDDYATSNYDDVEHRLAEMFDESPPAPQPSESAPKTASSLPNGSIESQNGQFERSQRTEEELAKTLEQQSVDRTERNADNSVGNIDDDEHDDSTDDDYQPVDKRKRKSAPPSIGANADKSKTKKARKRKSEAAASTKSVDSRASPLLSKISSPAPVEKPPPKKRGRKKRSDLLLAEAAAAAASSSSNKEADKKDITSNASITSTNIRKDRQKKPTKSSVEKPKSSGRKSSAHHRSAINPATASNADKSIVKPSATPPITSTPTVPPIQTAAGSTATNMPQRPGPIVHVRNDGTNNVINAPVAIAVGGGATGGGDATGGADDGADERKTKLPAAVAAIDRSRLRGLHLSTLSNKYDAYTTDTTWMCVFCKRGPHRNGMGDLFGPYSVRTAGDEYEQCVLALRNGGDCGGTTAKDGANAGGIRKRTLPVAATAAAATDTASGSSKKKRKATNMDDSHPAQTSSNSDTTTHNPAQQQHSAANESKTSPPTVADDDDVQHLFAGMTAAGAGLFEVWTHGDCAVLSPGVHMVGARVVGLEAAVWTASSHACHVCGHLGAMMACLQRGCGQQAHVPCARSVGWSLDENDFKTHCAAHGEPKATTDDGADAKNERKTAIKDACQA